MSRSGNTSGRYWLPLLSWLLVIFVFSTDSFSGDRTSRFIVPVLTFFFPGLEGAQLMFWHAVVRKSGHVVEYFILALLAWRTFRVALPVWAWPKLSAAALVIAVALTDEFHQSLTLSRAGSLVDVGIDCFGGALALALVLIAGSRNEAGSLRSHSVL